MIIYILLLTPILVGAIFDPRDSIRIRTFHNKLNHLGRKGGTISEFTKAAVLNIKDYISPLGSQNCLILIDNFPNVDISPFKWPVMHRHYVQGEVTSDAQSLIPYYTKIWTAPQLHNYTCSQENFYCILSPKFIRLNPNYHRDSSICLEYNRMKLATFSKLWNCEAHFSLYSPIQHYDIVLNRKSFPEIFDYENSEWEFRKAFPSSHPTLSIFVMQPTNLPVHTLARQVAANGYDMKYHVKNQIIIYIITSVQQSTYFVNTHFVNSAFVVCLYCKYKKWLQKHTNLPKSKINSKDLLNLKQLLTKKYAFPLLGDQLIFDVFGGISLDKIDGAFNDHILQCQNRIVKNERFSLVDYTDALDLMMSAYAHEWNSIFHNYSYKTYKIKICNNGMLATEKLSKDTDTSIHFEFEGYLYKNILPSLESIAFEDKITTLRFVSCGRRSYSLLPFHELSNVFNKEVWIAVFVSLFILPILPLLRGIGSVGSFEKYLKYFDATFRILIGLDIPLNDTILQRHSVRYVILGFALAALILNNAYKSDNVYRMTLPRNIQSYTNFSDLVQNKFTVYTQLSFVSLFSQQPGFGNSFVLTKNHHIIRGTNLTQAFELHSQLHATGNINSKFTPDLDKFIYNFSDISDEVSGIAEKLGYPWNWNANTMKFRENLFKLDEQVLLKKLSSCQNIALVLPTYQCQQFAVTTKRNFSDIAKFVDVGEETYFKSHHVFTLKGVVPQYLIVRIKAALASGVFEWWQEIALLKSKYIGRFSHEHTLKKPNLSGNILVIFVCLLVGLALGLVCMLLECLGYALVGLKYIWYFVYFISTNFVRKIKIKCFR